MGGGEKMTVLWEELEFFIIESMKTSHDSI